MTWGWSTPAGKLRESDQQATAAYCERVALRAEVPRPAIRAVNRNVPAAFAGLERTDSVGPSARGRAGARPFQTIIPSGLESSQPGGLSCGFRSARSSPSWRPSSIVTSANNCFSREFSFSRSFSRLAWSLSEATVLLLLFKSTSAPSHRSS